MPCQMFPTNCCINEIAEARYERTRFPTGCQHPRTAFSKPQLCSPSSEPQKTCPSKRPEQVVTAAMTGRRQLKWPPWTGCPFPSLPDAQDPLAEAGWCGTLLMAVLKTWAEGQLHNLGQEIAQSLLV